MLQGSVLVPSSKTLGAPDDVPVTLLAQHAFASARAITLYFACFIMMSSPSPHGHMPHLQLHGGLYERRKPPARVRPSFLASYAFLFTPQTKLPSVSSAVSLCCAGSATLPRTAAPTGMAPTALLLALGAILLLPVSAALSPSPSPHGVCGGANVPYQYNLRPQFVTLLTPYPAGVFSPVEFRLCISSPTAVANVGLTALDVSVSQDGDLSATCPPRARAVLMKLTPLRLQM